MLALLLVTSSLAADATQLPIDAPVALVSTQGEAGAGAEPAADAPQPESEKAITVSARKHSKADPIEAINAKSFAATQSVDNAVTRPIALAYKHGLPRPVRDGLRNFVKNLNEPIVFVNFVLQHKIGKASETVARFALNSTIGGAGLFDVAKRKPFHLPRRPNGLAYTMGYYGIGPGPYLYLPFVGPTTVRDMIGSLADRMILPVGIGFPFTELGMSAPVGAVAAVDRRAEFDDDLEAIRASNDPYVARREFYLRKRQREIDELRGKKAISLAKAEPVTLAKAEPEAITMVEDDVARPVSPF